MAPDDSGQLQGLHPHPVPALVEVVCHAERLAGMLEARDVAAYLGTWGIGRADEVRLVARLAVLDNRRALRRDFDAYVRLAAYLDDLHAALRERRIFDPPCCGGYTACAEQWETP
jgi:hypothetical protein